MRSRRAENRSILSHLASSLLVVLTLASAAGTALAAPHYAAGTFTGTLNGQAVNWSGIISMDYATGRIQAEVSGVQPNVAGGLRPVTALVTIGGGTCAVPIAGSINGSIAFKNGVTRTANLLFSATGDTLQLVHVIAPAAGDTAFFTCTVNGSVPSIPLSDSVVIGDFYDLWHQESATSIRTTGHTLYYAFPTVAASYQIPGGGTPNPKPDTLHHPNNFKDPDINPLPFDQIRLASDMHAFYISGEQKLVYTQKNLMRPANMPAAGPVSIAGISALLALAGAWGLRRGSRKG